MLRSSLMFASRQSVLAATVRIGPRVDCRYEIQRRMPEDFPISVKAGIVGLYAVGILQPAQPCQDIGYGSIAVVREAIGKP